MDELDQSSNATFKKLRAHSEKALEMLLNGSQGNINKSISTKPLARMFTPQEAQKMIGISGTWLRKVDQKLADEGIIKPVEIDPNTGRRKGYTFDVIEAIRKHLDLAPHRDPETDKCAKIAFIQFKGGSGKTESLSNAARSFALKGYRVAVFDMDHQGSTTGSFGFLPDLEFKKEDTVIPYIMGEEETLHYAIRKTDWPNIDIVPACMALEEFNSALGFEMANLDMEGRKDLIYDLKRGIETIEDDYDIILIDSPPSSSVNAYSIMAAADGLVIPLPPAKHDLASTSQFFAICEKATKGVLSEKEFDFIKILITKYQNQGNRSDNDKDFRDIYYGFFKDHCYQNVFRHMSPITDAAAEFSSVYELEKPNKDILKELDQVFWQIEKDILKRWPSKKKYLKEMIEKRG